METSRWHIDIDALVYLFLFDYHQLAQLLCVVVESNHAVAEDVYFSLKEVNYCMET